jgi:hypothetical protein
MMSALLALSVPSNGRPSPGSTQRRAILGHAQDIAQ